MGVSRRGAGAGVARTEGQKLARRADTKDSMYLARGGLRSLARAMMLNDPNDPGDIEVAINFFFKGGAEAQIEALRAEIVGAWRSSGKTDSEIAACLGVSRQAVCKRFRVGNKPRGSGGRFARR